MNAYDREPREVKLRPDFSASDAAFKLEYIRELLTGGVSVRLIMVLRGSEVDHPEAGEEALQRVVAANADLATLQGSISRDGRRLFALLVPGSVKGTVPR